MKKLISLSLIFVMLISSPLQVLAQEVTFKPAITFEYDYYKPGQTKEYREEFIAKLRANLDHDYENITKADSNYRSEMLDWKGYIPIDADYYKAYGTVDKVKEAYNDFLYFNIYPKESPYYIDTALKADKDTTKTFREEDTDILYILNRYEVVSNDIKTLLRNNPATEAAKVEKFVRKIPTIIFLTILTFWGLEIYGTATAAVEATAAASLEAGVASAKAVKIGSFLAKFGLFVTLTVADIWITDYVAKEAERFDERLGDLVESVGFHRIMTDSVGDTSLFRAAQQVGGVDKNAKQLLHDTRFYRCFHYWEPWFKNEKLDRKIAEAKVVSDFYDTGIVEHTPANHKLIAGTLIMAYGKNQEGIPEITDENKDEVLEQIYNQNQYAMDLVRQELLRNYYALRFIRAELSNIKDPLRFDRAVIDLATTYKVMFVQSIDNRLIKRRDQSSATLFPDAFGNSRGVEHEIFYEENPYYEEFEGIDYLAPHVMDNIPYQGLNQKMYMQHELSSSREIPTDIGFDVLGATSTSNTYPTLLSRAQVNFLVQYISINDREREKAINDDIAARIAKRENSNRKSTDFSYLDGTNLTEGQKRAVRSNCGTK